MTSPANLSPVERKPIAKTVSKLGTAAGLIVGHAYVIKNHNDIFVRGGEEAAKAFGNGKIATAVVPHAVAAGFILVPALIGGIVGKIVGTVADRVKAKKAIAKIKNPNTDKTNNKLDNDIQKLINENPEKFDADEIKNKILADNIKNLKIKQ